jgi:tellurite resistance protein
MEFFPEIELTAGQAEVIARGMYAVARAEGGVHVREAELIKSFYGDVTDGSARSLSTLEQLGDIEPEMVATALTTAPLAQLFLKSCVLLSWADGQAGPQERVLIEKFAKALKVSPEQLAELDQSVKEYLLGHLSHLANVDATVEVAKKLKV